MHQYFSATPPSHDSEEYMTTMDLSFIPTAPQDLPILSSDALYHPYPNHSSFQLGDWYWNQGLQKSQADYKKLLEILGASDFNPADVSSTHWRNINSVLGVTIMMREMGMNGMTKTLDGRESQFPSKCLFPILLKPQGFRCMKPPIFTISC
jgi:hypothetical protein